MQVHETRDVLNKDEVLNVGHAIYAQLTPEIVPTGVDLLDLSGGVPAKNKGEFLPAGSINNELALKQALNRHWCEYSVPRVAFLGVFVPMR